MFKIMGKLPGLETEEIDSADTMKEARYLLKEYRMAFGPEWSLWIKRP